MNGDGHIAQEVGDKIVEKAGWRKDEDDVYYYRFITHLKFFADRLVKKKCFDSGESDDLLDILKMKYPDGYHCVEKITKIEMH